MAVLYFCKGFIPVCIVVYAFTSARYAPQQSLLLFFHICELLVPEPMVVVAPQLASAQLPSAQLTHQLSSSKGPINLRRYVICAYIQFQNRAGTSSLFSPDMFAYVFVICHTLVS